jgi:general secretion pathway protein G
MTRNNLKTSSAGRQGGYTLLELIITMTILSILVGAALPLARNSIKREREAELRRNLREIRMALDQFRLHCLQGQFTELESDRFEPPPVCLPKDLNTLVEGMRQRNTVDKTLRYLRRIPRDPMTNTTEWGVRSMSDDGDDIFDVYTKSEEEALNGTKYKDW